MLKFFTSDQRNALINRRPGEVKLGEKVRIINQLEDLKESPVRFVLLGIREDIGIRANLGIAGAENAWEPALKAFLNVQHNRYTHAEDICVLGALEFPQLYDELKSKEQSTEALRLMCSRIDDEVSDLLQFIFECGKVPLIIGGGHNNAYPIIKAFAMASGRSLNVLNIDPHTDYRKMEGRHSGNGFRYAREAGHLKKYMVFGLHENYNAEDILKEFNSDQDLSYLTFESLISANTEELDRKFKHSLQWLGSGNCGLEMDLDSICRFPVSALNPSGFSLNQARMMITAAGVLRQPCYFHLPEASPARAGSDSEKDLMAKGIAYLLTDFIKAAYS